MSGRISERDPITGRIVRGGGKPQDGDSSDAGTIDPESAADGATASEPGPRPKRGGGGWGWAHGRQRKRSGGGSDSGAGKGTGKARAEKGPSLDLSSFVGIWVGLHWQIAKLSDNPELQISENDAKEWLLRTQNVMRHYPLSASQKAIDWAAWTMVTSFMYVPRAAAIVARKNAPKGQPEPASAGATVFHFNQKANGSARPDATDFPSPPPIPPTVDSVVDEPELEPI
jgi:hypothetical protein